MDNSAKTQVLKMQHITKLFPGVRALDDVELELKKGEIHALIGENGAGKSTLMKILLGIYQPDYGEILYKGEPVKFHQPEDALRAGISMIHQEISMMPNLDVAGNIWIARERQFMKKGLLDHKAMHEETKKLLDKLEISLDPYAKAKKLSIAQLKMVELCRAISYHAQIIVMDEPTSALADAEIQILYRIVRRLVREGTTIVFISHKLEEIFEICDRITIMRDGKYIKTARTDEMDRQQLIALIAGRELKDLYPKEPVVIGETVFEVKDLKRDSVFEEISFDVRAGEVLGFCGLVGAGRTEIMRGIFGIDKLSKGTISMEGRPVEIRSPQDAIKNGLGFVTEDRLRLGCIGKLSLKHNMTLSNLPAYCRAGFINGRKESRASADMMGRMAIKAYSDKQLISQLSGGNQQKALIGRSLLTNPKVLIMDEPTRGIDVGSKSEIYKIINDLAKKGMAVMVVSSEIQELLGICDRILVISHGRITGEFDRENVTQTELMNAAFKQAEHT